MAELGQLSSLPVVKIVKFGVYLDGGPLGKVLLPKRYVPENVSLRDQIEVFLYADSEDIPIATTRRPEICVGQCGLLTVSDVNEVGTFVDWGLEKDLMIPFSELASPLKVGQKAVVVALLDRNTQRLIGSTKLSHHLYEESRHYYKRGQSVDAIACGKSEMGYKMVVNHRHLGLLYKDDAFKPIKYGRHYSAFIKHIRDDGKIDLTLQKPGKSGEGELQNQILEAIKSDGGTLKLSDKSPPDLIYQRFNVSKKNFKRALSALYKNRQIKIFDDHISLVDE